MSEVIDSKSLAQSRGARVAALALGIPHEVRLKLAKRMRAEQLRRYEEREKKQPQGSKAGHSALIQHRGNSSPNQPGVGETRRKSPRAVAFQAKDVLMDAAQNGDTEQGKTEILKPLWSMTDHNAQYCSMSFVIANVL